MASRSSATAVASVSGMARTVAIVPHTHWDREWYQPFEVFRARLVEMVDALVALLDRDAGFRHFMLDGQTVCLELSLIHI